jgi:predicted transposase YdaD
MPQPRLVAHPGGTSELSAEDLSGKIDSMIHQRRIREGLLTTAEQLMKRGEELGRREGQREGMREGMREAQRELVPSMVDRGMPVADVARYTGLAVSDIQSLLEDATT